MDDELADLLAAGERAAFHGRPAAGLVPLKKAVEVASSMGQPAEATAAAWLLGVCLAAAGRYGSALSVLEPVANDSAATAPERRLFAALACATVASVHRQLGRHSVARAYDEQGLTMADGADEATFDCVLGLAADAVGLAESAVAQKHLDDAAALTDGHPEWWRQKVRLAWVRAEVAMLNGQPRDAARVVEPAIGLAEGSGAPRHVAKSLLFLGVAQVQDGDADEAVLTLRRASTLADSSGTLPLLWPSRAVLGAMLEQSQPAESAASLASARNAVLTIADDLPEGLRGEWLGRPDVAALLGAD